MKSAGMWLAIFGFGSMALNFLGYEFKILMWIDTWGPEIGWGIRAALAATGVVMFVLGSRQEAQPARKTA